jgi:hypothetical protein
LLRLVSRAPGITRAKCALALEARNDSPEELKRIVELAAQSEDQIKLAIGASKANWDNAKKVLPKFAEQLGEVVKTDDTYVISISPGRAEPAPSGAPFGRIAAERRRPTAPRSSRNVSSDTIGQAGTQDGFDEVIIEANLDPAASVAAIHQRRGRLRRHNFIVKELAAAFEERGADLFEDPFDILAIEDDVAWLVEVKSLDGGAADERDRVQEALSQLLYYEAFVASPLIGAIGLEKIACFESPISAAHQAWLNKAGIATIWKNRLGGFSGHDPAQKLLKRFRA